MKNIKSILVILFILSSVFLGCIEEKPAGTPTATPTATETPLPTVVPATPRPTPAPGVVIPVKYIVWIDSDFGFYRVRAVKGSAPLQLPPDFNIMNFTVNAKDKVRWINDDSYDFPLTVISNEGLWTNRTGYLRWQGDRFEHIFNETGTFTFSIREYPRIQNLKIIVKKGEDA